MYDCYSKINNKAKFNKINKKKVLTKLQIFYVKKQNGIAKFENIIEVYKKMSNSVNSGLTTKKRNNIIRRRIRIQIPTDPKPETEKRKKARIIINGFK